MALRVIRGLMKFDNFMTDMGFTYYQAIGILESIWHFTATNAIQGDIGRHSNQDICKWIGYTGDADKLIDCLVKRNWLETHSEHRLIVHDWHIHADKSVKTTINNRKLQFCVSENLTGIPKKNIENQSVNIGSLSGSGAGAEYGAGAGAESWSGSIDDIKRHQPDSILERFTPAVRQASIQAAIAYQTRRYGGPNPSAAWYPGLLREAAAVFEVHDPPEPALEIFKNACIVKPTLDMPSDATFSQIAVNCGIKRSRGGAREPPWEASKRQADEEGRRKLAETVARLNKGMAC